MGSVLFTGYLASDFQKWRSYSDQRLARLQCARRSQRRPRTPLLTHSAIKRSRQRTCLTSTPQIRLSTNGWWKRAYFQMQGYYEYGLYHDDILQEDLRPEAREDDEVCEAVRRLPPDLQDERSFRICRAMNLSANKQILPKSE